MSRACDTNALRAIAERIVALHGNGTAGTGDTLAALVRDATALLAAPVVPDVVMHRYNVRLTRQLITYVTAEANNVEAVDEDAAYAKVAEWDDRGELVWSDGPPFEHGYCDVEVTGATGSVSWRVE